MTATYKIFNNYIPAVLLLFLNVFLHFVNSEEKCGLRGFVQYGLRLETEIFHLISKPGLKACGDECMYRKKCNSFNYNKLNHTCELLAATGTQEIGKLVSREGYYHGDIPIWPMVELGPCASRPCPIGERCVVLSKDEFVCMVTGFTEKKLKEMETIYCFGKCSDPQVVQNAVMSSSERGVSMTISYTCSEGFALIGNPNITCKTDGTWTIPGFTCKDCGNPPLVSHAKVNSGSNLVGKTRSYTCSSYYILSGWPLITCQANGSWSNIQFYCRDCGEPPTYTGATIDVGNTYIGSTRKYTCDNRYRNFGEEMTVCQSDGTWKAININCLCEDLEDCSTWISYGYCNLAVGHMYYPYMHDNCRRACGYCY